MACVWGGCAVSLGYLELYMDVCPLCINITKWYTSFFLPTNVKEKKKYRHPQMFVCPGLYLFPIKRSMFGFYLATLQILDLILNGTRTPSCTHTPIHKPSDNWNEMKTFILFFCHVKTGFFHSNPIQPNK